MKTVITILLLCCCYRATHAQSQYEMNMDAYHSFQETDSELNAVYKKIIKLYKTDTIFIKNLKKTQKIWIQFRDAEMNMKYPDYGPHYPYGSVHPMCWNIYKEQLTRERIITLKDWIEGIEEGDVCLGSAKTKYEIEHPEK